jgi:predicted nucleic acid-binding protein
MPQNEQSSMRQCVRWKRNDAFVCLRHGLAAAASMECDILHIEDLQHGQSIEGVTIVNPLL